MEAILASPYVVLNGLGFIVGLRLVDRRLGERLPDRQDAAYVLLVFSVVVGWFGAHVLDWLVGSQTFGRAGFTYYGGFLAALAFLTAAGLKAMRPDELSVALNTAVVPLLVAHGVGRIGCFLAGCCYGVRVPGTTLRHPAQIYESVFLFVLAFVLSRRRKTLLLADAVVYLASYPTFRFFVEFLRDDDRGGAFGLSTSQWISLALVVGACFLSIRAAHGRANNALEPSAPMSM